MVEFIRVASWEALAHRSIDAIDRIVVHRIEVSQEDSSFADTAADTARFFLEHPLGRSATGGAIPYPVLIAKDGTIEQVVPFDRVTPHARIANVTGIGIGCIGDFRRSKPGPEQLDALVTVCASLCQTLELDVSAILGHDEISGGSHEPDKQCPGPALSMDALRERVKHARANGPALRFVWSDADLS